MDDFKKINIQADKVPDAPVVNTMPKQKVKINYQVILPVIVIFVVLPLLILGYIAYSLMPLRKVISRSKDLITSGREIANGFKEQDLDKAKTALQQTREDFISLKSEYQKINHLAKFPFLGIYIQDGNHLINAGEAGLDATGIAIDALEPNADLLGFKGGSKFVAGSADERIQLAVKTMQALSPQLVAMAGKIEIVRKEIDYVDPKRYPANFRGQNIRGSLVSARQLIDNAANLFVNAQPLLTSLPSILGEPDQKRYLVIFQNDKELRSTGGFITAYAQFRLEHGKMILEKSDDIYALDAAMSREFPAPREILTFHKGVYNLHLRDSNLSPDYKVSMENFEKLYDTVKGKEKIDGILAVDTHVLVETLKILGSEYIAGREFSAESDKRCNCPKAVYELEDYSTRPVGYVRTDRKGIIGTLLQQLMQKALGVSPSQYWGRLFQMLIAEINQKHVLAYFHDPEAQKGSESFNMGGRIMTADSTSALLKYQEGKGWDYLHVNNSNMAGAKSNMFVTSTITKEVTVNSDNTLSTKLTINYKNPFPGSDCGLESGGLCLNAPLRNWLRIYVPKGSTIVESKGTQSPKDQKPEAMTAYDDLNKTVFEGFLIVNPLGSSKVEISYKTPFTETDGKYKLLVQKQPGVDSQDFNVSVNGKNLYQGKLISDSEYTY